jgi:hypothetical protein
LKNFPGILPPDPLSRGRKEREDGRGKEGIRDTDGRRGVVWDREGEEGMRGILEERDGNPSSINIGPILDQYFYLSPILANFSLLLGKRGKGKKEGRKRKEMTWPPNKIPGSHGRKSRGGTNPPRICSGGTLIQVVPPDFCRFSKFQALAMDSSPPPDFNPGLRHCWISATDSECAATVPVYLTNVVILKMLSTSRMHLLKKGRLIYIFVQNMK